MTWKTNIIFATLYATASTFAFYIEQPGAPIISSLDAEIIPNSYIVVLKDTSRDSLLNHQAWLTSFLQVANVNSQSDVEVNQIKHIYDADGFRGYAGRFQSEVVERIREMDDVAYIEADSMVYISDLQKNAPWGLSRISHREALSFGTYNKYLYANNGGNDVTAYIVDTGVNVDHEDFEGRATWGATIPDNDEDKDGNGHGTHCAGTVAGKRYGVAKSAKIVAVKVLRSNGSGTMADVVKGVTWVITAHQQAVLEAQRAGKKHKGSVANMSLGGGKSIALNEAVNSAVASGVHFAVAAGNDNRDACSYSPASAESAVTVGASAIDDERAWFSNHGKCVDIFAPGKDITSTWIGSNVATNTISGTSMASPHICGLLAYMLSFESNSTITPKELKNKLIEAGTKNVLQKLPGETPNILAYNNPPKA
ncbi:proteinase B [Basidiobolus ranarum]|uniref:Proteinase B n=1 Tax=Basidiobolus ranarum TaxID=34480 RepID=A0ABR2WP53_9FUNG